MTLSVCRCLCVCAGSPSHKPWMCSPQHVIYKTGFWWADPTKYMDSRVHREAQWWDPAVQWRTAEGRRHETAGAQHWPCSCVQSERKRTEKVCVCTMDFGLTRGHEYGGVVTGMHKKYTIKLSNETKCTKRETRIGRRSVNKQKEPEYNRNQSN